MQTIENGLRVNFENVSDINNIISNNELDIDYKPYFKGDIEQLMREEDYVVMPQAS